MPEEYGGAGMNVIQYVGFIRELAYASPAYRSIVSINIGMVCKSLVGFGTDQQKAHWLPKLTAGSTAAFGPTEPDSGSSTAAMTTRSVRAGNGYVLNRNQRHITNAPFHDMILVIAPPNDEAIPTPTHFRPSPLLPHT